MPKDLGPCQIPGCPKRAKAKGYCMGHYGALWRAHALKAAPNARHAAVLRYEEALAHPKHREETSQLKRDERVESVEFQLKWARRAYDCAIGWQTLSAWSARIKQLEAALALLSARPASAVKAGNEYPAESPAGGSSPAQSDGVPAEA